MPFLSAIFDAFHTALEPANETCLVFFWSWVSNKVFRDAYNSARKLRRAFALPWQLLVEIDNAKRILEEWRFFSTQQPCRVADWEAIRTCRESVLADIDLFEGKFWYPIKSNLIVAELRKKIAQSC